MGSLPSPNAKNLVGESSEAFFLADFFADFVMAEKGFFDFLEEERNGDLEVEDFNFLLGVEFNVFSSLCIFS